MSRYVLRGKRHTHATQQQQQHTRGCIKRTHIRNDATHADTHKNKTHTTRHTHMTKNKPHATQHTQVSKETAHTIRDTREHKQTETKCTTHNTQTCVHNAYINSKAQRTQTYSIYMLRVNNSKTRSTQYTRVTETKNTHHGVTHACNQI